MIELPDWLPWWAPIVIIVPLALFAIAFLLMPFSVFGVKSRLDEIQQRLDDIQTEIRSLALRLPDPGHGPFLRDDDSMYVSPPPMPPQPDYTSYARPPIPPAASEPLPLRAAPPASRPVAAARPSAPPAPRAEPRLDWPRN